MKLVMTLLSLLAASAAVCAQDIPGCARCHEEEFRDEAGSVHAGGAATCVDCHGGDPRASTKEAAHGAGFRGKIARRTVPELCGGCHSDVRRMNPYGLQTDQLSQYRTSRHGEAQAAGRTDAAVCSDCHHAHGIRRVKDPASPVFPANVPATCGACHSNADLMTKHGMKHSAEANFRDSIHGELLLKKNDLSAPQCATCHGSHGAVPPGFADIGHVCGKCHVRQLEFFESSPHAAPSKEGAFNRCVTCHSNHMIARTAELIFPRCAKCHDRESEAIRRRDAIRALMQRAADDSRKTGDRLAAMARTGFFTDDEQVLLEGARTSLMQMPVVQHSLDTEKVAALERATETALREIGERLDRKERAERAKKLAMIPVWLFLVLLAWVSWARRRRIRPEGSEGTHA